jgi:methylthioribose-1-phosphate isomerase
MTFRKLILGCAVALAATTAQSETLLQTYEREGNAEQDIQRAREEVRTELHRLGIQTARPTNLNQSLALTDVLLQAQNTCVVDTETSIRNALQSRVPGAFLRMGIGQSCVKLAVWQDTMFAYGICFGIGEGVVVRNWVIRRCNVTTFDTNRR